MPLAIAKMNLAEFGAELNLNLEFDENNTCIVGIDDSFSVHFTYESHSDSIYIYSPLHDELPSDAGIRMRLYETILEGALLGGKMAGCGAGIALKEELILIHHRISMAEHTRTSALRKFMPIFVTTVEQWRKICQEVSSPIDNFAYPMAQTSEGNKLNQSSSSSSYAQTLKLFSPPAQRNQLITSQIQGFLDKLKDLQSTTRLEAAEELIKNKVIDDSLIETLTYCFSDTAPQVREKAMQLIRDIKKHFSNNVVIELINNLDYPDGGIQQFAVCELNKLIAEDQATISQLIRSLTVPEEEKIRIESTIISYNSTDSKIDDHWYSELEMKQLLQALVAKNTDIELLLAMIEIDERAGDRLNDQLIQFHNQRTNQLAKSQSTKNTILIPINLGLKNEIGIHWALLYLKYQQDSAELSSVIYVNPYGQEMPANIRCHLHDSKLFPKVEIESNKKCLPLNDYDYGPWLIALAQFLIDQRSQIHSYEKLNLDTILYCLEGMNIKSIRKEHQEIFSTPQPEQTNDVEDEELEQALAMSLT